MCRMMVSLVSLFVFSFTVILTETEDVTKEVTYVQELGSSNFTEKISSGKLTLIMFYAPWCGHCKKFKPEYEETCKEVSTTMENTICGRVDCTQNEEICKSNGVQGYPTIIRFIGEKKCTYNGQRTREDLYKWFKSSTQGDASAKDSVSVQKFISENDISIVAFFVDKVHPLKTMFEDLSCSSSSYSHISVDDKAIGDKLEFKTENALYIYKNGKHFKTITEAQDSDNLSKLLFFATNTLVPEYNPSNSQSVFSNHIIHYVAFIFDSTKDDLNKFTTLLNDYANEVYGKIRVFTIDTSKEESKGATDYFKPKSTPMFCFYNDETGKFFHLEGDDFTVDNVKKFSSGCIDGTISPYTKKQPIPQDWDKKPVKELVVDNFETAKNSGKTLYVLFYAPWCGHCKEVKPKWEKVGEHFANSETIMVGQMDHTENDMPDIKIEGYPTIIAFKGEQQIVYKGGRSFEELRDFALNDFVEKAPEKAGEPTPEEGKPDSHEEL